MSDPPEPGNEEPRPGQRAALVDDSEIWGLVYGSGHWDHGGWSADGGRAVCACGTLLAGPSNPGTEGGS